MIKIIRGFMRYLADSNRCRWCCRPLPSRSAKVPFLPFLRCANIVKNLNEQKFLTHFFRSDGVYIAF